jgi:hypothetical protein
MRRLNDTRTYEDVLDTVYGPYLTLFLLGSFLALPGISIFIFRVFGCQDIDPSNHIPGADLYLMADYSISCTSERYVWARKYSIAMVFLYPVGVPLLYYSLLSMHSKLIRQRFARRVVKTDQDDRDERLIRPLRFLFYQYEPQFWYWVRTICVNVMFWFRWCILSLNRETVFALSLPHLFRLRVMFPPSSLSPPSHRVGSD